MSVKNKWEVYFIADSRSEFDALTEDEKSKILHFLDENLVNGNPRRYGRVIKGRVFRFWKYNIADCDIICQLSGKNVNILAVKKRAKLGF